MYVFFPALCKSDRAGTPVKNRCPQTGFNLLYGCTQGGLGDVEALGGLGDIVLFGNRNHVLEISYCHNKPLALQKESVFRSGDS